MIDFYTWTTPNGYKVAIMLEETGLDYTAHAVDIGKGAQFKPDFLKIAPNNKIPAIVDHDAEGGPLSLFESGAILLHLARKSGRFLPEDPSLQATTLQWLMWQMGGYGPMLGQFYHFTSDEKRAAENPYSVTRYTDESVRLHNVLNDQLSGQDYVAGEYSIADMAIYPWAVSCIDRVAARSGKDWPHIRRWMKRVGERSAVGRGYQVPAI